ncbi:MAG: C-GCAxxG-C-C family protein [Pseudomonadota bacterium]
MLDRHNKHSTQTEALIAQIKKRARNLYLTRQLLCTEAVLLTLNQGLNGGLSADHAVAMAAPFCVALGESGCICGALSGAVMACGLFLGNGRPYRHRRDMREGARQLHDTFKAANGATCCRVLSQKVKHDKKAHFQQCADLTAEATEMAARLILHKRPELITRADNGFLLRRDSKIGGTMTRLFRFFHSNRSKKIKSRKQL